MTEALVNTIIVAVITTIGVLAIINKLISISKDIENLKGQTASISNAKSQLDIVTANSATLSSMIETKLKDVTEALGTNIEKSVKEFGEFKRDIATFKGDIQKTSGENLLKFQIGIHERLEKDFGSIKEAMNKRLLEMNQKVDENISANFNKTKTTFEGVLLSLGKMEEAQKKIEGLSQNVLSLQDMLSGGSQGKGKVGEMLLDSVLHSVFGNNKNLYELQYELKSKSFNDGKKRVDAVIKLPKPTGYICIDSKFPSGHYSEMIEARKKKIEADYKNEDKVLFEKEEDRHTKIFMTNVINRVREVAEYIAQDETADFAIMFVPSESIFAEITCNNELILKAAEMKVWITSPASLVHICHTANTIYMRYQWSENADIIRTQLAKLSEEFGRYTERWNSLVRHIDQVSKDVKDVSTTSDKITKQFANVKKGSTLISNRTEDKELTTIQASELD